MPEKVRRGGGGGWKQPRESERERERERARSRSQSGLDELATVLFIQRILVVWSQRQRNSALDCPVEAAAESQEPRDPAWLSFAHLAQGCYCSGQSAKWSVLVAGGRKTVLWEVPRFLRGALQSSGHAPLVCQLMWRKGHAAALTPTPGCRHPTYACLVASTVSDSPRAQGPWPARLLCPWDSPGKNTGVGCHFLLQIVCWKFP